MKKQFIHTIILMFIILQWTYAQCYPDRHSTTWLDSWISCDTSQNPNTVYGSSHWILYDLGYEYTLNETKIWNLNEPKRLNNGINEYTVDYSLDGATWTNLGNFTMNQASGMSIYEGEEGPDFDGVKARYVLITPLSNFGGDCFGFSELKIQITDPFEIIDETIGFNASVYPNPFIDNVSLKIKAIDNNKPVTYGLYDILGREIIKQEFNLVEEQDTYELELNGSTLSSGIYILNIRQDDNQRSFKLLKRD
jgi:hypothetical protein